MELRKFPWALYAYHMRRSKVVLYYVVCQDTLHHMRISPYLFFLGVKLRRMHQPGCFYIVTEEACFACNAHYTVYAAWIEKTLEGPHLMKEGKNASGILWSLRSQHSKIWQLWLAKCYSDLLPVAFMIHQDKGPWPFLPSRLFHCLARSLLRVCAQGEKVNLPAIATLNFEVQLRTSDVIRSTLLKKHQGITILIQKRWHYDDWRMRNGNN